MSKSTRPILIMLSVFALLNVMFVPIFDVWGGLFPSDVDRSFFDVIEIVFEDADDWSLWVVQLTMSIFVPTIFMFIMSLIGNRGLFITSNVIGIVLWFKQIIDYGMEDDGFEDLFDFEDGSISIGTWIAIGIFIISFFVALNSKKKVEHNATQILPTAEELYSEEKISVDNNTAHITYVNNFCPNCGAKIDEGIAFCGKCGQKL